MDGLANTDKKEKYSELLFMVQKPCDQDLVTVVRKPWGRKQKKLEKKLLLLLLLSRFSRVRLCVTP